MRNVYRIASPRFEPVVSRPQKSILFYLVPAIAALSIVAADEGCADPNAVTKVATGADFAVCVLDVYAADAGQPFLVFVGDAVAKCGGDAVQVGRVFDAHKNAEIKEQAIKQPLNDAGLTPVGDR